MAARRHHANSLLSWFVGSLVFGCGGATSITSAIASTYGPGVGGHVEISSNSYGNRVSMRSLLTTSAPTSMPTAVPSTAPTSLPTPTGVGHDGVLCGAETAVWNPRVAEGSGLLPGNWIPLSKSDGNHSLQIDVRSLSSVALGERFSPC